MLEDRKEDLSESANDAPASETPTVSAHRYYAVIHQKLRLDQVHAFIASREPRLSAALWVMLGVFILMGLGTWQVLRSQEKNRLIIQVEQDLASAPRDISVKTPKTAEEWADLHYKPVQMTGSWMPLRSFRLAPRTYEEQTGYQWIIPFRLENGQVILVNRGFVPENMSIVPPRDGEKFTVSGVGRMPETQRPRYVPENLPSKGEWVWLDLAAMGHEIGMGEIAPVIVYENRMTDKDSYPIGGQIPLPFHNRHWHYAVTWYCLALALMGVWMTAIGPKTKKPEDEAQKDASVEAMDPVARRGLYPEATD